MSEIILEFDTSKMPNFDQPQLDVHSVGDNLPVLSVKRRKFTETEEYYTVSGLEETIKNYEDQIATLQANKQRYEAMLKWAKENPEIAVTHAEVDRFKRATNLGKTIAMIESNEEKTPEDHLELTKLKKELKEVLATLSEPIKAKAESLILPQNADA